MATYYAGSGGGCFAGSSTVRVLRMSSTTTTPQGLQCDRVALTVTDEADEVIEQAIAIATPLHKLRAGDRVLVAGGEVATVKCVVELYYEGPM